MPPLSPTQVHILTAKLQALQQELRDGAEQRRASAAIVELDQTRVGRLSRMDALQQQAQAQAAERRAVVQLQRIEAAFRRLEQGNYGICTECDEAIGIRRLIANPCALLCHRCAQDREQEDTGGKRPTFNEGRPS